MMKRTLLVTLVLFCANIICFSQSDIVISKSIANAFETVKYNKGLIMRNVALSSDFNEGFFNGEDILQNLIKYTSENSNENNPLIHYKENINALTEEVSKYSGRTSYFAVADTANKLPIVFFNFDSKSCLMLSSFVISSVYNTLSLDSRARAKDVIMSNGLNFISKIYNNFKDTEIEHIGVSFLYSSKPANGDVFETRGEYVCLLVPVDLFKQYKSYELSDVDLFNKSAIFLFDRELEEVSRISISF